MKKIPKQDYTAEFKESAVKRVKAATAGNLIGPVQRGQAGAEGLCWVRVENIRLKRKNEIRETRGRNLRRMCCEVLVD